MSRARSPHRNLALGGLPGQGPCCQHGAARAEPPAPRRAGAPQAGTLVGEHAGCRRGLQITPGRGGEGNGLASAEPMHAACRHLHWRGCARPAPAPGEEEGTAGEEPGEPRGTFPPPQSAGCQHSAPRSTSRRRAPSRRVPHGGGPRGALGNVPRAVPPHLPQHELMLLSRPRVHSRSSSPGGCFPESSRGQVPGRAPPPGRGGVGPGFVCTLHLVPLSALPGSARAAVIAAPRSSPRSPCPGAGSPLEEPREASAGRRLSGRPLSVLALRRVLVRGSNRVKQVRAPKVKAQPPEGEEAASSS